MTITQLIILALYKKKKFKIKRKLTILTILISEKLTNVKKIKLSM